jgi:hypothetical protein
MRKFLNKLQSQVPLARTNIERQGAMFAHLNSMVEDYQTFTTIVSAEQAATMASTPIELNVPAGQYLLAGGYIYYSSIATTDLELGTTQYIYSSSLDSTLFKSNISNITKGGILFLTPFNGENNLTRSGKLFFATSENAITPPDGPVEITVYLTTLNLSII